MAGVDLFASLSDGIVEKALREAKRQADNRLAREYEDAIDYLENRQIEDVRSELQTRYGKTQAAGKGQSIEPVTIPLVERYVAEAANAYNRPVKRTLVDDDGTQNDEATDELHRMLDESGYDERMHRVEQLTVLLRTCGALYEAKRGKLRTVVVPPHLIHPVSPPDLAGVDPSDQDDYLGFIVEQGTPDDSGRAIGRRYSLHTRAERIDYEGQDPFSMQKQLGSYPNPFTWPQVADTDDQKGVEKDAPLQMLTLWHYRLPIGEVICDTDPDMVYLNREINVQLSILLDTLRIQGWSQLIMQLDNPNSPPAMVTYGSRFALPLATTENAAFLSAPNNYAGIVEVLRWLVKLAAIAKRQSPADFATEGTGPQSGFAKLVESLPKIEARTERIRRLKHMEEQYAWPRIASIGKYLGKFSTDVSGLRMRVEYADIEFPRTPDEVSKQQEHEFKYGLSSPAAVLAKRLGITEEEAAEKIAENKQSGKIEPDQEQAPQPPQNRVMGMVERLVARDRPINMPKPGKAEVEDEDETRPPAQKSRV